MNKHKLIYTLLGVIISFVSIILIIVYVAPTIAQDSVFLPIINSVPNNSVAVEAANVTNDSITQRKPGEPTDFAPTPFPDRPLPPGVKSVTPGQPAMTKLRPSQEELERLANPTAVAPDTPYRNHVVMDVVPVNSKSAAHKSDIIVITKVHQIYPAQWSTVDGKRPANPHDNSNPAFILTRIDVKVEQVLYGETEPNQILTLFQNGGEVGEEILMIESPYPEFAEGQTLLLYLASLDTSHLKIWEMPAKIWSIRERYIIDPSTKLATNPFTQRSLDELIAEIDEVKPQDSAQQP